MLLIVGQVVKNLILKKVESASCYAILCDEVCDIANNEQLVTFIMYIDPHSGKETTQVLSTKNLLTGSESGDTEMTQMVESKLEMSKLAGLATDGALVLSFVKSTCKLLLSVHCICHRLVLERNDANDDVPYIKKVEKYIYSCCHYFIIQQRRWLLMQKQW